ncbi:MAG: DUF4956 domain-containing protein [Saprospiraceae bacterium]|nr:DUF4956 domain-containing protein [Bacteroidia bacterium]NNE14817.1 DUF4956 domain-containing protein [Saprospiraceae bacterium]NNL90624.1 DUF4956 domain-containing protein [Saprospiraceae bacterium]
MFDISLLENNPDLPSFYATLITVLFAFFLSSLITITYQFTTKSIYRNAHYLQGLALISIVSAMVMQAIGDSLARGLGMLGALAIIRFRTVLNDPRNIAFMFASLAAGIACGVLGFSIALTGTLIFCLAAILLSFSPLSNSNELIGNIKLRVPKDEEQKGIIEGILKKFSKNFELNQLQYLNPKTVETINEDGTKETELIRDNLQEFTYLVRLNPKYTITELTKSLKEIDGLVGLRLNFKKQPTNL